MAKISSWVYGEASADQRKTVTIYTFHVTTLFADNTIELCQVERVKIIILLGIYEQIIAFVFNSRESKTL